MITTTIQRKTPLQSIMEAEAAKESVVAPWTRPRCQSRKVCQLHSLQTKFDRLTKHLDGKLVDGVVANDVQALFDRRRHLANALMLMNESE